MAWDKGWDFRATSGYVTDPANCTYVIQDVYPTTRNTSTFGFDSAFGTDSRDRDTTYPRIAGMNYVTSVRTFRIDLPATGDYDIYLGLGDWASTALVGKFTIKDNTTTLFTINHNSATGGSLYDATDTQLTASNWNSSNAKTTKTFASTIFIIELDPTGPTIACIDHIFLSQVVATGNLFRVGGDLNGIGSDGPFFKNPIGRHRQPWPPQQFNKRNHVYIPAHLDRGELIERAA